ncbi:hypothetical protein U9R90_21295 [Streptomyces sp. E11-3]
MVRDAGDGWERPEIERYSTRWERGRVVVEREDEAGPVKVEGVVRVRGL